MRKLFANALLAAGTLLLGAAAQAAVAVHFTPSVQHAQVNDIVTVEVSISGLGDEILSGFDLNFTYDWSLLTYSVIDGAGAEGQLGGNFGSSPFWFYDNLDNGNIGVQASAFLDDTMLAAQQANAFVLFQFEFLATADGVARFTLGLDPDFERNLVGLGFATLQDVNVGSACIAIGTGACQVPEPASYSLLLLGLAARVAAARHARSRRRC